MLLNGNLVYQNIFIEAKLRNEMGWIDSSKIQSSQSQREVVSQQAGQDMINRIVKLIESSQKWIEFADKLLTRAEVYLIILFDWIGLDWIGLYKVK